MRFNVRINTRSNKPKMAILSVVTLRCAHNVSSSRWNTIDYYFAYREMLNENESRPPSRFVYPRLLYVRSTSSVWRSFTESMFRSVWNNWKRDKFALSQHSARTCRDIAEIDFPRCTHAPRSQMVLHARKYAREMARQGPFSARC